MPLYISSLRIKSNSSSNIDSLRKVREIVAPRDVRALLYRKNCNECDYSVEQTKQQVHGVEETQSKEDVNNKRTHN